MLFGPETNKTSKTLGGEIPIFRPVIIHLALLLSDFCGRSFLSMPNMKEAEDQSDV